MSRYTDVRPPMPDSARMMDSREYTDPKVFRAELERVFLDRWVWAGRGRDIAEPGAYMTYALDGESVIIVRDASGALQAHHNVCRHRGTQLVDAPRGHFDGGAIQCPYHAWTYGFDGCLRSAPGMSKSEGFEAAAHGLGRVAASEWDGHVFINVGSPRQSLSVHLDDLPKKLAPWGMADLVEVARVSYDLAANWKLIIQNYSECLHCPVAHPQLQSLSHYLSGENDRPHDAYLGGRMELRPGVDSLTADGTPLAPPLPGLDAAARRIVAYYAVLPNLLVNLHPDYMMTFSLWPRAADRTEIDCVWYVHEDTARRDDFDPSSAVRFWDETNRQDWALCERAQRGIASRAYVPGRYSNREELLVAFDRWIQARVPGHC